MALSLQFGYEHSELTANSSPDECLKEAPTSCQGGAGGNRLPIAGAYDADEWFVEAILPLVQGKLPVSRTCCSKAGFRWSDYSVQGSTESWKYGLSWEIVPGLPSSRDGAAGRSRSERRRVVQPGHDRPRQRHVRSVLGRQPESATAGRRVVRPLRADRHAAVAGWPGSGHHFGPGQRVHRHQPEQPGVAPKKPRRRTLGFVWEPDWSFTMGTTISLDYYDIEINDYIDDRVARKRWTRATCSRIRSAWQGVVRIGGAMTKPARASRPTSPTSSVSRRKASTSCSTPASTSAAQANLRWAVTAHQYLTNEFQTTSLSPVVDCKGFYGTSCDPVPEFRSVLRTQWYRDDFDASLLWRHIGGMDMQSNEANGAFRSVPQCRLAGLLRPDVWLHVAGLRFEYRCWLPTSLTKTRRFSVTRPVRRRSTRATRSRACSTRWAGPTRSTPR